MKLVAGWSDSEAEQISDSEFLGWEKMSGGTAFNPSSEEPLPRQRRPKEPSDEMESNGVDLGGTVFDDGLNGSEDKASTVRREQYERLLAQLKAVRLLQRDQSVPTILLNIAQGKAVDRPLLAQDEFLSQAIAAMSDSSHAPAERRALWNGSRRNVEDDVWTM
jgi:hypothetical protein